MSLYIYIYKQQLVSSYVTCVNVSYSNNDSQKKKKNNNNNDINNAYIHLHRIHTCIHLSLSLSFPACVQHGMGLSSSTCIMQ